MTTIEHQIAQLTKAVADLSRQLSPWITTAEMCARYECTPKTLNAMERRGDIPVPRRAAKHCALAKFSLTSKTLDVLFRKARDQTMAGDLTFHDGRATALTLLARRVDILTLARISQHSDLRMLQRYYRESSAEIAGRI